MCVDALASRDFEFLSTAYRLFGTEDDVHSDNANMSHRSQRKKERKKERKSAKSQEKKKQQEGGKRRFSGSAHTTPMKLLTW